MYSNDQVTTGPFTPKISVIGVGGAGGNAVNNMIASKLEGVNFLAVNTDAQALENSLSKNTIRLGVESTGGLGAGARPEIGRAAAEETLNEVMEQLGDQNMVFITAGMGGGTGTGAAPIIAQACKERGILTVGVVTKPFQFEGAQRMRQAEAGIDEMAQYVDTLIVIPNQNLFRIANEKTTFADAFKMADNVLQAGVRGLTDLMVVPGMINLDFADVRSATSEMGKAMMGTGEATGDRRAIEAAEQAINNPLLDDVSMKGARSVIINITGGHDITLFEIEEACNRINDEVDPDATIIFGSTYDDSLEGVMRITVVATGIEAEMNRRAAARPLRATNTNAYQMKKPVETTSTETMADSFVARYPEPSRHGSMSSSYSGHAAAASTAPQQSQDISYHTAEPTHVAPQPQQAVASIETAPIAENYIETQEDVTTGTVETEYVAEGATMRRVEVQQDYSHAPSYNNSVIPPFAPPRDQQVTRESSLTLNPPVRHTAPQAETRKTPSLFDRITGRNRSHDTDFDSAETNHSDSSSNGSNGGAMMSGLTAPRKTIVTSYDSPAETGTQGMLNIESPKVDARAKQNVSDDLDIPAFLRRQIS